MSSPKKLKLDVESAKKVALEELNDCYFEDREVENFLKVLGTLIERDVIELEGCEDADSEDGKFDIIITIARKIGQLLEGDIDSLNVSKTIIKMLKTLKALVGLTRHAKNNKEEEDKKKERRLRLVAADFFG